jgi:hypothetical protein
LREPRGAADQQRQDARGHRIERAQVADPARAGEPAEAVDNVVRCHCLRFVDDDGAIHALNVSGERSLGPDLHVPFPSQIALS